MKEGAHLDSVVDPGLQRRSLTQVDDMSAGIHGKIAQVLDRPIRRPVVDNHHPVAFPHERFHNLPDYLPFVERRNHDPDCVLGIRWNHHRSLNIPTGAV